MPDWLYFHAERSNDAPAVFGVKDGLMGEVPGAMVVPRSGVTPSEADLLQFCRERLPAYQVPVSSVLVEALPRNESGKLLAGPTLRSRSARGETQSE